MIAVFSAFSRHFSLSDVRRTGGYLVRRDNKCVGVFSKGKCSVNFPSPELFRNLISAVLNVLLQSSDGSAVLFLCKFPDATVRFNAVCSSPTRHDVQKMPGHHRKEHNLILVSDIIRQFVWNM